MKREISVFTLFLSTLSLVSARYYDLGTGLGYGMEQIIYIIQRLFEPLLFVFFRESGELMFERILFLLIIISIVYVVISRVELFKDNKTIIWIITLSVSFLTSRFMTEELLNTIILPYTVLGVSLTAILPIIIYFTFVEKFESATIRKMLWIFFIIVFIGIWNSRYTNLGALSWIYFFSAIAALIFLLFDGTIRRLIIKQRMKELDIGGREKFATKIRREIRDVNNDYREGFMTEARYKKQIKQLNKQLDNILKN